jgi:Flp pilus assembly protein TadG
LFGFLKQKKGSATIEAAVMLPVFVSVVLGFLFFMGAIKESMALQQAAREGAIYYATYGDSYMAVEKTKKELERGGIDPQQITITPVASGSKKGIVVQKESKVFTGYIESTFLRKEVIIDRLF